MKHLIRYKIFESTSYTKEQIEEATETLMYSLIDILDDHDWGYTISPWDKGTMHTFDSGNLINTEYDCVNSGIQIRNLTKDNHKVIASQIRKMVPEIKERIGMSVYVTDIHFTSGYCVNVFIDWQSTMNKIKSFFGPSRGRSDDGGNAGPR